MKTIPSNELKSNLDAVLNSSQSERIVISREGKPCAVLVGIQDCGAEYLQLAASPDFWHMVRQRRARGGPMPLADVEAQLKTAAGSRAANDPRPGNRESGLEQPCPMKRKKAASNRRTP
jgi:prevent-host-death family protein